MANSPPRNDEGDVVFITADAVSETKAWLTRNNGLLDSLKSSSNNTIRIFSDPSLSFMQNYGIIGGHVGDDNASATNYHWSMSMLVFDTNGVIFQFERDVNPSDCFELVTKTIREM